MSQAAASNPAASWDSAAWSAQFQTASAKRDSGALRRLRCDVWETTVAAVKRGAYTLYSGATPHDVQLNGANELQTLHSGTRWYASTDRMPIPADKRGRFVTRVSVEGGDCLEIAQRVALEEAASGARSVAVLNMASRRTPGGGVQTGAGAQEENLCRRSTLFRSLFQFVSDHGVEQAFSTPRSADSKCCYPIAQSGGIYSPPMCVFRSSEATGYAFLEQPYSVSVLTVPAVSQPKPAPQILSEEQSKPMRTKIRAIFRIAAANDEAVLILSAFGCGAFGNPPACVARLFREILKEEEFDSVFSRVVFAIFDDHNAGKSHNPNGNLKPFIDEFANYAASGAAHSASSSSSPPQAAAASSAPSSQVADVSASSDGGLSKPILSALDELPSTN